MKTTIVILLTLAVATLTVPVQAQDKSKSSVTEKQQQREAARMLMTKKLKAMISNKTFILEADFVGGRNGNRIPVASNLNFIMIDSAKMYFQLGNTGGGPGLNGVGGATIEGKVTKYEYKEQARKKGTTFYITVYMLSSFGSYDISITAYNTGKADATIADNRGYKLKYYGDMVSPAESRIYRGIISR